MHVSDSARNKTVLDFCAAPPQAKSTSWACLRSAQGHGSALAAARLDMLDGAAAALEGERDPRCLLAGFETVAVLAQAFARAGGEARRRAPPPVSPGLLSRTLQ